MQKRETIDNYPIVLVLFAFRYAYHVLVDFNFHNLLNEVSHGFSS